MGQYLTWVFPRTRRFKY